VSLVREQKHEVMHLIDGFSILHVCSAPLGKNLLSQEENEVFNILILCELHVLFGVLEAHLNAVENWSAHRNDKGLFFPECI